MPPLSDAAANPEHLVFLVHNTHMKHFGCLCPAIRGRSAQDILKQLCQDLTELHHDLHSSVSAEAAMMESVESQAEMIHGGSEGGDVSAPVSSPAKRHASCRSPHLYSPVQACQDPTESNESVDDEARSHGSMVALNGELEADSYPSDIDAQEDVEAAARFFQSVLFALKLATLYHLLRGTQSRTLSLRKNTFERRLQTGPTSDSRWL